jgi:protein SCO1/2
MTAVGERRNLESGKQRDSSGSVGRAWAALVLALAVASCGGPATHAGASTEGAKRYALRGQIVRLEDGGKIVVVRHQKIEGWMDAMTMEFPVRDSRDAESLHAGDQITATVFVRGQDYWIGEVRREFVK